MTRNDAQAELTAAAAAKTLTMESAVAQLRAIVIGVNVLAWAVFIGPSAPRAPLALTIIGLAVPYAIWSYATRPYERYPLLRFGGATLAMDAMLISLWVLGTGGAHSEFWVIYIVSVVSIAMRYDMRQTIATAFAEAALYALTITSDGGMSASLSKPSPRSTRNCSPESGTPSTDSASWIA